MPGWPKQVPGSPLVGLGAVFVREGERNGIDPRALVAIAMHESVLGTAGSGASIHNAFGWGPAIAVRELAGEHRHRRARPRAGVRRSRSRHPGRDPASLGAARRRERPDRAQLGLDRRRRPLLRGHGRGSVGLDRVRARRAGDAQAALCPTGPWGGTQRPVEALAALSGLPVTSTKRSRADDGERRRLGSLGRLRRVLRERPRYECAGGGCRSLADRERDRWARVRGLGHHGRGPQRRALRDPLPAPAGARSSAATTGTTSTSARVASGTRREGDESPRDVAASARADPGRSRFRGRRLAGHL